MNCDEARTYLNDYIDGLLEKRREKALGEHLRACAECREEERALRALVGQARGLPATIMPDRDLWPGIKARVEGNLVDIAAVRQRRPAMLHYAVAAAAAIVLVVGAVVVWLLEDGAPADYAENNFTHTEQEYLGAKEELLNALKAQEASLSPETVATVEANLAVIEGAVRDIRLALADDPDNPHLERILLATYRNEVRLLHQAVHLANES